MTKYYKSKKQKDKTKTNHHIIPKSRGGSSKLENIALVSNRDHQFYHSLFYNKTPEEIVKYLVNDYWNGNWEYVQKAYNSENDYL
ncbi:MAG TPA: HNH endonuclease [Candidatus Glassbacteria bacterium]|nr:HNH endonuclease [Candidatus Glassbacteria bacterium]